MSLTFEFDRPDQFRDHIQVPPSPEKSNLLKEFEETALKQLSKVLYYENLSTLGNEGYNLVPSTKCQFYST